jgi:hypothetical protein
VREVADGAVVEAAEAAVERTDHVKQRNKNSDIWIRNVNIFNCFNCAVKFLYLKII